MIGVEIINLIPMTFCTLNDQVVVCAGCYAGILGRFGSMGYLVGFCLDSLY